MMTTAQLQTKAQRLAELKRMKSEVWNNPIYRTTRGLKTQKETMPATEIYRLNDAQFDSLKEMARYESTLDPTSGISISRDVWKDGVSRELTAEEMDEYTALCNTHTGQCTALCEYYTDSPTCAPSPLARH